MATKSSAGWVILAAALAVPGFMFYQWYAHLNTQSKKDLETSVRRHMPAGAPIFGTAPASDKMTNPMAQPGQAAPASSAPGSAPVGAASASAAAAAAAQTAAAQPNAPSVAAAPASPPAAVGATVAAATVPVVAAAAPQSQAPAPSVASSTGALMASAGAPGAPEASGAASPYSGVLQMGTIAPIVLARDPMLSPYDMVRIAEDELKKRRAAEEVEGAATKTQHKKRVVEERPAESLVDLQGIVSTGDGDKAIVNGEVVGEGDLIGQVKVVKITPTAVVFLYHKKRFIKGISK
jgi:hypothetical protein